jgi:hypothetical protein
MTPLGVGERSHGDEPPYLDRVVVQDCGLQVLALRRGLPKLPPQPPQQAHGRLVGHEGEAR